ncbi:MAG: queuosine 5'-phosphate N-glycosylase/hydrolase [Ktedonobacteraceae bacterium]
MTDGFNEKNIFQDNSEMNPESDTLGVLSSTRWVVQHSNYAWINQEQVAHICPQLLTHYSPTPEPAWYERFHFHDGTERTVNWLLVLDALNFCFWAEKDKPRWRIIYKGEILDGYWAEAASLSRAVEVGIPLWDAEYLSTMSREDLAFVFRPAKGADDSAAEMIPLFDARLAHVHEIGRVLLERYSGQFTNAIEKAKGSAVNLALLLEKDFNSFRDVAFYHSKEIRFLKRAQICVADLYGAFGGKRWGAFTDLDKLTIFADYKLPQVLRHFGVLEYAPGLAQRIDNLELLQSGGEEEVEIRAATIWACEILKYEMSRLSGRPITAIEIDQILWYLGQNSAEMRPYHRTRTVYY